MKFSIFDRVFESDLDFPELVSTDGGDPGFVVRSSGEYLDIEETKRLEWCHHWRADDGTIDMSLGQCTDGHLLYFDPYSAFLVDTENRQIIYTVVSGLPVETLRHQLIDQVIPRLFESLYKETVIHASAVEIEGKAILFLGPSGAGKSTFATFLSGHGYQLISDDCVLLTIDSGQVYAVGNYPGARLFQDSLDLLEYDDETVVHPMSHYSDKCRLVMSGDRAERLPVSGIVLLNRWDDSEVMIERLDPATQLMQVISQTFLLNPTDQDCLQRQLKTLSEIITTCEAVYELSYPNGVSGLGKAVMQLMAVARR